MSAILAALVQAKREARAQSRTAALITPSGCTHCGIPRHDHFQRWTSAAGWHGYAPPTTNQIKTRMLQRRKANSR